MKRIDQSVEPKEIKLMTLAIAIEPEKSRAPSKFDNQTFVKRGNQFLWCL